MASIFVSPGVYTKEQDFTVFASRIGLTRLGVVGKFLKGPAFESIKVSSTDEQLLRFGPTNTEYPATYVANAFLGQSNELSIVRILGNNGFDNSPAWLIIADKSTTYSGSTTATGMTFSITNSPATGWTFTTTAATGNALANNTVTANTVGNNIFIAYSGSSVPTTTWLAGINATAFSGYGITVIGDSLTTYITSGGSQSFTLSANTLEYKGVKSGSTLAVLRSKRNQISGAWYYDQQSDINIGNISTSLGAFTLSGSTGPLTAETLSGITVSLDETRDDYIIKMLGKSPKIIDDTFNFYVERIYPHFIREAASREEIIGLNSSLVYTSEVAYTDFNDSYDHAVTPWIVSRVIGGSVRNLFKIHMISDGDSSNVESKFSIANIDINNKTFDLIVRRFEDTDATAGSSALERWANLSLNPDLPNYIAKVIGTNSEDFPRKSLFIEIEMAAGAPINTVPAGFRGYSMRTTGISGSTSPNIYYKTVYLSGDSIFKTYMGISELGYTSFTQNQVSVRNAIKTLESDLFAYEGGVSSGRTTIKGFHMENIASSTEFISGDKDSLTGYTNDAGTLIDKNRLKFTVAPAGGFDGWDKYKTYSDLFEEFTDAYQNNVDAFKAGIDIFENPEHVDINLFATPGIDYSNNTTIIRYALEKIEDRKDTLYIIDAPRITAGTEKGTPEEAVSTLEATGIDSNYATTYWPWVQLQDPFTGKYTYQSPTFMAARAIALTDNKSFSWVAPAGIDRGSAPISVVRADIKLSKNGRDTLYAGRINPMATYTQYGVVVWGQKTLQVAQSALDRINVRRLLLQLQRLVAAASITLVFEQNDQTLRDQFTAKVEPILLQIQAQRGLADFKIVVDETLNTPDVIDRNTLVGKIQIKPVPSAEFIDLTFQVLPSGARFEDF